MLTLCTNILAVKKEFKKASTNMWVRVLVDMTAHIDSLFEQVQRLKMGQAPDEEVKSSSNESVYMSFSHVMEGEFTLDEVLSIPITGEIQKMNLFT